MLGQRLRWTEYFAHQLQLSFEIVQNRTCAYRKYVYSVAVYHKKSNEVGRNDNFRALARKLSFLPTKLDIFDVRQHYIRVYVRRYSIYISMSDLLSLIISNA